MVKNEITNLFALLLNFNIILGCVLLSIYSFKKIGKITYKNKTIPNNTTNSLVVGISSGLIVLIFGWWLEKFNFPEIALNSFKDFLITFFAGFLSILVQIFIFVTLILWALSIFLNTLFKDKDK